MNTMILCKNCPAFKKCGGLIINGVEEFGCMHRCGNCIVEGKDCPFACPNNPKRFVRMLQEVGRLDYRPQTLIQGPRVEGFPLFIPQIYHGSRRFKPLQVDAVAISITDLLARTKRRKPHHAFCLDPETRIIGLGVAKDHELEKWWWQRQSVVEQLQSMHLDAVSVPNFSIFANAPRHQNLINISRIHHFSESLSTAGIATIPHIYAETDIDWQVWGTVLKEQPYISMVAMEFQTGLRAKVKGIFYIERLAALQQAVGRPLHLVAVGGAQYRRELWSAFGTRLTIIDATAFMKTFRRIRTDGPDGDERLQMQRTEDLADLLQANVLSREKRLCKGMHFSSTITRKFSVYSAAA